MYSSVFRYMNFSFVTYISKHVIIRFRDKKAVGKYEIILISVIEDKCMLNLRH